MSTNDFPVRYKSFKEYLDDYYQWSVTHNEFYSVDNMSDKDLEESIIQDILGVTMFCKEFKMSGKFTVGVLTRLLYNKQARRVVDLLKRKRVKKFLVHTEDGYRIKDDKKTLQAAMDMCGVWYDGFEMPEDVIRRVLSEGVPTDEELEEMAATIGKELANEKPATGGREPYWPNTSEKQKLFKADPSKLKGDALKKFVHYPHPTMQ